MTRGAGYRSEEPWPGNPGLAPPPIPNLPGFTHPRNMMLQTQKNLGGQHRKAATLKFIHGTAMVEESGAPVAEDSNLSRYNLLEGQEHHMQQQQHHMQQQQQQQRAHEEALAREAELEGTGKGTWGVHTMRWTGAKTPGWLKYDGKVLCFFAYSLDEVLYSPLEQVRVRRFALRYYLEDNSLEIIEPNEPNSGLPQGTYLRRDKVKLADGHPLLHTHLHVGEELTIYGRKFVVVGCDPTTRQFYADELGVVQRPDMPLPSGRYDELRKVEDDQERLSLRVTKSGNDDDPFEEPLGPGAVFEFFGDRKTHEHLDNKLLRFYCCWDDTKRVFGQKLPFTLHYFLRDDTIEVVEPQRRNTGRDPFPLLLSRCKLPKTPNVPSVGGRPLSPRSKRKLYIQYYQWSDLRIGGVVKVYGRELFIYDMDDFSRRWMQEQLQLSPNDLKPIAVDFDMGPKRPPLQVPPNTGGIGSEEDSMLNVLFLVPRRPHRDYNNYMENWNKVLRFTARLVPLTQDPLVGPHDHERRFIISFFLLDNTLTIWEPKRANSGIRGGMFLERTRVRKQDEDASYLTEDDFHVGAVVTIYARHFLMLDADDYTLRYMESDPQRHPHASYEKVYQKVVDALAQDPRSVEALKRQLIAQDKEGLGYVTRDQLQAALSAVGVTINDHEAVTLVRNLGADQQGVVVDQLVRELLPATSQQDQLDQDDPQQRQQQLQRVAAGGQPVAVRGSSPERAGRGGLPGQQLTGRGLPQQPAAQGGQHGGVGHTRDVPPGHTHDVVSHQGHGRVLAELAPQQQQRQVTGGASSQPAKAASHQPASRAGPAAAAGGRQDGDWFAMPEAQPRQAPVHSKARPTLDTYQHKPGAALDTHKGKAGPALDVHHPKAVAAWDVQQGGRGGAAGAGAGAWPEAKAPAQAAAGRPQQQQGAEAHHAAIKDHPAAYPVQARGAGAYAHHQAGGPGGYAHHQAPGAPAYGQHQAPGAPAYGQHQAPGVPAYGQQQAPVSAAYPQQHQAPHHDVVYARNVNDRQAHAPEEAAYHHHHDKGHHQGKGALGQHHNALAPAHHYQEDAGYGQHRQDMGYGGQPSPDMGPYDHHPEAGYGGNHQGKGYGHHHEDKVYGAHHQEKGYGHQHHEKGPQHQEKGYNHHQEKGYGGHATPDMGSDISHLHHHIGSHHGPAGPAARDRLAYDHQWTSAAAYHGLDNQPWVGETNAAEWGTALPAAYTNQDAGYAGGYHSPARPPAVVTTAATWGTLPAYSREAGSGGHGSPARQPAAGRASGHAAVSPGGKGQSRAQALLGNPVPVVKPAAAAGAVKAAGRAVPVGGTAAAAGLAGARAVSVGGGSAGAAGLAAGRAVPVGGNSAGMAGPAAGRAVSMGGGGAGSAGAAAQAQVRSAAAPAAQQQGANVRPLAPWAHEAVAPARPAAAAAHGMPSRPGDAVAVAGKPRGMWADPPGYHEPAEPQRGTWADPPGYGAMAGPAEKPRSTWADPPGYQELLAQSKGAAAAGSGQPYSTRGGPPPQVDPPGYQELLAQARGPADTGRSGTAGRGVWAEDRAQRGPAVQDGRHVGFNSPGKQGREEQLGGHAGAQAAGRGMGSRSAGGAVQPAEAMNRAHALHQVAPAAHMQHLQPVQHVHGGRAPAGAQYVEHAHGDRAPVGAQHAGYRRGEEVVWGAGLGYEADQRPVYLTGPQEGCERPGHGMAQAAYGQGSEGYERPGHGVAQAAYGQGSDGYEKPGRAPQVSYGQGGPSAMQGTTTENSHQHPFSPKAAGGKGDNTHLQGYGAGKGAASAGGKADQHQGYGTVNRGAAAAAGGKENAQYLHPFIPGPVTAGGAKDMRWAQVPGSIGYNPASSSCAATRDHSAAGSSDVSARPDSSQAVGGPGARSLWQTTNMAMGGVGHHGSFRKA